MMLTKFKEHITPVETITRAFEAFIDSQKSGQIAECSTTNIFYRDAHPPADEHQEWMMNVSWDDVYGDGNMGVGASQSHDPRLELI